MEFRKKFRLSAKRWLNRCLLLAISSVAVHASSWKKLPSLPASNGGFVGGEVAGKVVVIGGTNWEGGKKNWLQTVHEFDPATLQWKSLKELAEPMAYGIGVTFEDALIVVGGSTGQVPWKGRIQVKLGEVVSSKEGGLDQPAVLSAAEIIGHEIIVVGGTDDAANVKDLGRGAFAFDVKTDHMRKLPDFPGPVLGAAATAVVNGELYIFTGVKWDPAANRTEDLAEAYAFSPERNSWRMLKPYPFTVRGAMAVALDEKRIYIAGGFAGENFTDRAFIYDIPANTYTPAKPLPYAAQPGLLKCGSYIYCIGGEDKMKHRSAAAYRIKLTELER